MIKKIHVLSARSKTSGKGGFVITNTLADIKILASLFFFGSILTIVSLFFSTSNILMIIGFFGVILCFQCLLAAFLLPVFKMSVGSFRIVIGWCWILLSLALIFFSIIFGPFIFANTIIFID